MVEKIVILLAIGIAVGINSYWGACHLWVNINNPYIWTDMKIIAIEEVFLLGMEGLVALDIGISIVRKINPPRQLPEF